MNGFTTTETPRRAEDLTAADAERVQMALAEAGCVGVDVVYERESLWIHWHAVRRDAALWARALDVANVERRCLPCIIAYAEPPRVSPDCEGTGRCGVES